MDAVPRGTAIAVDRRDHEEQCTPLALSLRLEVHMLPGSRERTEVTRVLLGH